MNESKKEPSKQPESLSILQTIGSVLAAALGVQKRANLERDLAHGKASRFIIAGVIFTVLFVLTVYGVVQLVLSQVAR